MFWWNPYSSWTRHRWVRRTAEGLVGGETQGVVQLMVECCQLLQGPQEGSCRAVQDGLSTRPCLPGAEILPDSQEWWPM